MINLVTFDLDGTIIDNEWAHEKAKTEIALSFGVKGDLDLGNYTGRSNRGFWEHIIEKFELKGEIDIEAIVSQQFQKVMEFIQEAEQPESPGLTELLMYLKNREYILAVTSGSDESFVAGLLQYLGIATLFDVMVTKNHVNYSKPSPDTYMAAQRLAGIRNSHALGVEDSEPGCQALKGAGMISVGYTNRGQNPQMLQSADYLISEMTHLIPILEKLQKSPLR